MLTEERKRQIARQTRERDEKALKERRAKSIERIEFLREEARNKGKIW